ncbi:MAG TPA: hypothetical protein VE422_44365 [Terriglobia bacterium]|nr:hypothetical protein [Terriglobia bacterium]
MKSSMDVNNRRVLWEIGHAREKLPNPEGSSALTSMKAATRHDNCRCMREIVNAANKSSNPVSLKIGRPRVGKVGFDDFSRALSISHVRRRFLTCIDDFINALDICSADIDDFCPDTTILERL